MKPNLHVYGWVLSGGKKWYRAYVDKLDNSMYFIRDGQRVDITKYYKWYYHKSDRNKKMQ